jgi:hypothetical protein
LTPVSPVGFEEGRRDIAEIRSEEMNLSQPSTGPDETGSIDGKAGPRMTEMYFVEPMYLYIVHPSMRNSKPPKSTC